MLAKKIAFNITLWSLLVWAFTKFHLPRDSLFYNALQNSGHGIVFFILTIIAIWTFYSSNSRLWKSAFLLVSTLFLLGVIIESVQHLMGRGASLDDIAMNGAGIVSGFVFFSLLKVRFGWLARLGMACVVLSLNVWILQKPAAYVYADLIEHPLPELNDFERIGSGIKLSPRSAAVKISRYSQVWADNASRSLRVEFGPGKWPSVIFQELEKSWCGYGALRFDAFSPLGETIPLRIRVDDRSLDIPDYSMTVGRTIEPGTNEIVIPLSEFALNARNRGSPRFTGISSFQVFLPGNDRDRILYFDNFRLGKLTETKFTCSY